MLSVLDQENLTSTHQTTAANKPLNQNIRSLQPKTPGPIKTPFRAANDENALPKTTKATKNAFATPAPKTTNRAPLGAKTTNAKAQFQTPAPGLKQAKAEQTGRKTSTARRSVKKRIYVEPEPVVLPVELEVQEDGEPEYGYAPPPIVPLADPPIDDIEIDQTYPELRPENFNRGVGEIYFQSPKDENGFSISLKKQEDAERKSLQDDLDMILQERTESIRNPDEEVKAMIAAGPRVKAKPNSQVQLSKVNTLKARSAASALSQVSAARTHQRLPLAVARETAASKQRRKPAFTIAADHLTRSAAAPVSKTTIGFPKAKKPASILPASNIHFDRPPPTSGGLKPGHEHELDQANISPRKFVQLYGEPPIESEMWFRLMELEIKDRHREEKVVEEEQDRIFELDLDDDLDDKLASQSRTEEDFELNLDDF